MKNEDFSSEELTELIELLIMKVESLEETIQKSNSVSVTTKTDKWFNLNELRDYLPSHPDKSTIYAWVNNSTIPSHKPQNELLFRKSEIDKWVNDNKRKSEVKLEQEANTSYFRQLDTSMLLFIPFHHNFIWLTMIIINFLNRISNNRRVWQFIFEMINVIGNLIAIFDIINK